MNTKYRLVSESITLSEDFKSSRKTAFSVLGIVFFFPELTWPIYRTIRAALDEKTRRCGVFGINTARRQVCMLKVKVEMLNRILPYIDSPRKKQRIIRRLDKAQNRIVKLSKELANKGKASREPSTDTSYV